MRSKEYTIYKYLKDSVFNIDFKMKSIYDIDGINEVREWINSQMDDTLDKICKKFNQVNDPNKCYVHTDTLYIIDVTWIQERLSINMVYNMITEGYDVYTNTFKLKFTMHLINNKSDKPIDISFDDYSVING